MKTVAKICIKHEDMFTMFDGFSNMYFGWSDIPLDEGDHVIIETAPKVRIVKKLDSNDVLFNNVSKHVLEPNDDTEDFFSSEHFLLDKDFYS